ncbi:uridine diphosphate glucose pyrophosphatase NUDT14 [Patella vulgata]|uniref:uridine diphosphate glucose pyrophosphatase NUDT14 n=1 Tax=Patella vulgata TaxID=6465 RepID=UPI0024A7FB86|nr:uridine diphosphate glucose pyrophosphatase NUDT14 [Patella vulgata]
MDKISDVSLEECSQSKYLRPYRLRYTQNGIEKTWDLMKVNDSLAIIVYNPFRKVLVFVKQFRAALYWAHAESYQDNGVTKIDTTKYPGSLGLTHELCAGLVDKDCNIKEIAQQELLEELGYKVPLYKIEKITSYRSGIGISASRQTLFYAEVSDVMKVGEGGGLVEEGEFIETVEIPVDKGKSFIYDESIAKPIWTMFALQWFYDNKYKVAKAAE